MRFPFPRLWAALVLMWLALNGSVSVADVVTGAVVALVAVLALSRLQTTSDRPRRPWLAIRLAANVLTDIARSNMAVAALVFRPGMRGRTAGFTNIPLDMRHPTALAALACIITATPGTAWAGYDSRSGMLTMHVLDLVDEAELARTIKERYERPLMEIFE